MQKVLFKTSIPKAVIENGKPVVKFDTSELLEIVASTKSLNNRTDELKASGVIPTSIESKDLFLNRAETKSSIEKLIADSTVMKNEPTEIKTAIIAHIMKALDTACLFYKDMSRKAK